MQENFTNNCNESVSNSELNMTFWSRKAETAFSCKTCSSNLYLLRKIFFTVSNVKKKKKKKRKKWEKPQEAKQWRGHCLVNLIKSLRLITNLNLIWEAGHDGVLLSNEEREGPEASEKSQRLALCLCNT